MANLQTLDKIDQKFNDFRKEIIEDRKDIHKSINSMVFKIVGLLAAIIALIKFLPEIFQ